MSCIPRCSSGGLLAIEGSLEVFYSKKTPWSSSSHRRSSEGFLEIGDGGTEDSGGFLEIGDPMEIFLL